jgi:hypothetical protein
MSQVKLFFAHDTRNPTLYKAYENICELLSTNKKITYDQAKEYLDVQIQEQIEGCDLFIADITPYDTKNDSSGNVDKYIFNENVMTEVGIALSSLPLEKIMLIYMNNMDFKPDKSPLFIRNINHEYYDFEDLESLIDKINVRVDEVAKILADETGWDTIKYFYPQVFVNRLCEVTKSKINKLNTHINRENNRIFIWLQEKGTTTYYIDVGNRQLIDLKTRTLYELGNHTEIVNELRHIEIKLFMLYFTE